MIDPQIAKKLSQDIHPSLLEQDSLSYLVNGDIQDYSSSQNGIFVQNLPGNTECVDLLPNFLGYIQLDKDELLLFNAPGLIRIVSGCVTREITNSDCLNLQGEIEGRYQYVNGERVVYWIEKDGPIRTLNIDCLPKLRTNLCTDCIPEYSDELDCDATLYNYPVSFPCVSLDYSENGSIPNGVYQIAIAYLNDNERVTDYFIAPTVIKPFNSKGGNFSITVTLDGCPQNFDRVELVLITHRVDRGTVAQRINDYPTSSRTFTISTLDEARYVPIDLSILFNTDVKYQGANHIANTGETLILAGTKERPALDGQLVANKIETFWVTMAVRPEEAHKYPSFNRGEVYPFDIAWVFRDGQESKRFHIPNNVPKPNLTLDLDDNYWEHESKCNPELLEYWEIRDTSNLLNYKFFDPLCGPVVVAKGNMGYWESKDEIYNIPGLECQKVRYHKFPTPMAHGAATALYVNSSCGKDPYIQIMGVQFENIETPKYCTGELASDIIGYKIYVGDREGQESILSNGLLYNVRSETLPGGEESMFQNYPFNDLNPDEFLLKDKKNQGNIFDKDDKLTAYYKDRFTYVSPDLQYIKGQRGTSIEILYESIGSIRGEYHETEGMPKYQVLSPLGRLAATSAGIIEANEVLKGKNCVTTRVETTCNKKVPRKTNVTNFPVTEINSSSSPISVNIPIVGPAPSTLVGTLNGPITDVSSMVTEHNYFYEEEGDDDCTTTYQITDVSIVNYFNPLGDLSSAPDTCRLLVETNAPKGVILTVHLNGTAYPIYLDENGKGSVQLNANCTPLNTFPPLANEWTAGNVNGVFNPKCDCTGDTSTTTIQEQQECEPKIRLLESKPWHERLPAMVYYFSQGRQAVGDFLQQIITPTNYAIQYTATASHTEWAPVSFIRRKIDLQQYITPNKLFIDGKRFNNWNQISADYLELNAAIDNPVIEDYSRILSSDIGCQKEFTCITIGGKKVQAVNYYAALKRRLPNQYGNIDNYQVRQISCVLNTKITPPLLGGDVYITKHKYVRKFPLFTQLPLLLPNNTEFDLSDYPNIGFPRFWMDNNKESAIEDIIEDLPVINVFFQDYNLDNIAKLGQCFTPQDWYSLLGNPTYLLAWLNSLPNGWSNPFKLQGRYYTHVTGIVEYWGESKFIADNREENSLRQSKTDLSPREIAYPIEYEQPELFLYNLQYLWNGLTRQTLTQDDECCKNDDFRLVYSLQQRTADKQDKWRQLVPRNYTTLPSHTGKITVVREIDDHNLFIGAEDGVWVTQQDDGLLTNSFNEVYLGSAEGFSRRLRRLTDDTTGFGGIIDSKSLTVTKYGTYWYDRKRRKFLQYTNGVGDVTNNLQSWFQKWGNEPVKAVYDNFSDNIYLSVGEVGLVYKPKVQDFVSFLDWSTDEFVQLSNNFISKKDNKLWLHNQNKYQRFFNKQRRFEVGLTLKNKLTQSILQSIDVYAEFFKDTDMGRYYLTNEFFTEITAFNQLYSTGKEQLILKDPNNQTLTLNLPTASLVEDFTYRINNLSIKSNQQPIIRPVNGVNYDLGLNNLSDGRPIQGKYIEVRLAKHTDTKVLMQLGMGLNQIQTTP